MMAIVSSSYALLGHEIDDRRYVVETHIDNAGIEHRKDYLASVGTDYSVVMAEHVNALNMFLEQSEFDTILNE